MVKCYTLLYKKLHSKRLIIDETTSMVTQRSPKIYIRLFTTKVEQESVKKCDRNNEREKQEFILTLINCSIDHNNL